MVSDTFVTAFLAIVAFCFSMTIGVLWEFVEFGVDSTFQADMQKDFVVQDFGSVSLDPTGEQKSVHVRGVERTVIECEDGTTYVVDGGYLDLGVIDTMKDLLVNFAGAAVFCTFGFLYTLGSAWGRVSFSTPSSHARRSSFVDVLQQPKLCHTRRSMPSCMKVPSRRVRRMPLPVVVSRKLVGLSEVV